jgi:hypothetical protein
MNPVVDNNHMHLFLIPLHTTIPSGTRWSLPDQFFNRVRLDDIKPGRKQKNFRRSTIRFCTVFCRSSLPEQSYTAPASFFSAPQRNLTMIKDLSKNL